VAVYPDRIILKNSTDPQATIETAIASGGTDAIQQGELVIGREDGAAQLYTVDALGAIVTISGSGGGGTGGLAFWGGGDFDTGVSDGQPADGGSFD
jgi:hypothetical protein